MVRKILNLPHKKCKQGGNVRGEMPKNANVICEGSLNTILRFEKVKAKIYRFSAKRGSKSLCLHKENGSWYIIKKKTKEHCSMGARVINPKNTAFLG